MPLLILFRAGTEKLKNPAGAGFELEPTSRFELLTC
jgi:hypothetical protein